ncbi:MAG TPA: type II toxin-antitoxin system RelB/DinJ family antitoxin [Candidatus Cybelea sp.]|jgi:addiction module RelB/DinJ family antitoxin|nr:type II toxin-antitoxin system RelB/DinJ family antitoxin [Candidatus Cybelea sp.]
MTVLFRCRVEKRLLKKANEVTERLGTSTPEMIRVFLTEIARTGKVPVNLNSQADEDVAGPWTQRAATLESFYDPAKTW